VPDNAHFCTEAFILGEGLEQHLEAFLTEHPDTVLVIIDTLQMIRDARRDMTYANDYRDLTSLKRIADAHSVAILLIHHLRKEYAEDVFSRISGTTAISGAVDTSLTLVEQERGSGEATLYCIGRDIEYCELELARNADNVWELTSDSRTLPKGGRLILLLSTLMKDRAEFIGTPTELAELIDPAGMNQISPRKISGEVSKTLQHCGKTASRRRCGGVTAGVSSSCAVPIVSILPGAETTSLSSLTLSRREPPCERFFAAALPRNESWRERAPLRRHAGRSTPTPRRSARRARGRGYAL